MNVLWVALGGAIGAGARYGVNELTAKIAAPTFPVATLLVNVVGCLIMGVIAGMLQGKLQLSEATRLFLMTGILGGFTTFSAFALDVAMLTDVRAHGNAALYVVASVILSLLAVYSGLALARLLC